MSPCWCWYGRLSGERHIVEDEVLHHTRNTLAHPRPFLMAVLIAVILNPLNSSTISVALGTLLHHFHNGAASVTWIISGYYLGSAIAQPVLGRLGDLWGHRPLIYTGLVLIIVTFLPHFPPPSAYLCCGALFKLSALPWSTPMPLR